MNPNFIRALYQLAYEYHSGQWSRGYRLLCRVQRYAKRHGIDLTKPTNTSSGLYLKLVKVYSGKL